MAVLTLDDVEAPLSEHDEEAKHPPKRRPTLKKPKGRRASARGRRASAGGRRASAGGRRASVDEEGQPKRKRASVWHRSSHNSDSNSDFEGRQRRRRSLFKRRRASSSDSYVQRMAELKEMRKSQRQERGLKHRMKHIGPSYQYDKVLFCIPLALAVTMIGLGFGIHGSIMLYNAIDEGLQTEMGSIDVISGIIFALFEILTMLAALYALIKRSAAALNLVVIGYNVTVVNLIVDFITSWLEWFYAMTVPNALGQIWEPKGADLYYMISFTLQVVLILVMTFFWVYGTLSSLKAIFAAGGSGWEGKSYVDFILDAEDETREKTKRKLKKDPELLAELTEVSGSFFTTKVKAEQFSGDDRKFVDVNQHIFGRTKIQPSGVLAQLSFDGMGKNLSRLASRVPSMSMTPRLPSRRLSREMSGIEQMQGNASFDMVSFNGAMGIKPIKTPDQDYTIMDLPSPSTDLSVLANPELQGGSRKQSLSE